MKLSDTSMSLEESHLFLRGIMEDGEAPRWDFDYSNFHIDPNPDILLLGSYVHPSTQNNLVGGINLHYLNKQQIIDLARNLPEIMKGRNLYQRYWSGRRILPTIFKNYYRTYNSQHIHGIKQNIMYPKYGFSKAVSNWLKKNIGGLFKSKEKRKKDAEPEFPDDLQSIRNKLNTVVKQLQDKPESEPDEQEIEIARDEYKKQLAQKDKDIEKEIFKRNTSEPQDHVQNIAPDVETQDKPDLKQQFEREREENRQELLDPENEIEEPETEVDREPEVEEPNRIELDLEESIVYYSPIKKRYIMESYASLR